MNAKTFKEMGGELYIGVECKDETRNNEIINEMHSHIKVLIDKFNFFDPESLLSKLNKERTISYDEEFAFMLKEALRFYDFSKGSFNIGLGKAIEARKKNKKSDTSTAPDLLITKKHISILNKDQLIDLGGIAKGYILDCAIEAIQNKYGKKKIQNILIDARGDIVCGGISDKIIDIENPFSKEPFMHITLKNGAIVTSGHNRQTFKHGSHIVGNQSDVYSLTLYSETKKCYELDALCTYLIQLPTEYIIEQLIMQEQLEDVQYVIISQKGNVFKSDSKV